MAAVLELNRALGSNALDLSVLTPEVAALLQRPHPVLLATDTAASWIHSPSCSNARRLATTPSTLSLLELDPSVVPGCCDVISDNAPSLDFSEALESLCDFLRRAARLNDATHLAYMHSFVLALSRVSEFAPLVPQLSLMLRLMEERREAWLTSFAPARALDLLASASGLAFSTRAFSTRLEDALFTDDDALNEGLTRADADTLSALLRPYMRSEESLTRPGAHSPAHFFARLHSEHHERPRPSGSILVSSRSADVHQLIAGDNLAGDALSRFSLNPHLLLLPASLSPLLDVHRRNSLGLEMLDLTPEFESELTRPAYLETLTCLVTDGIALREAVSLARALSAPAPPVGTLVR